MESKRINQLIFILGLLGFWAAGDNYAAAPLLVGIAKDFNIEINIAVLNVTAYMLCYGLFTFVFGPLGDKYGRAKWLLIAAFGASLFSISAGFSNNLPMLIVLRAVNGAFAAGIFPITQAYIADKVEVSQRQNAIAQIMAMIFFGSVSAMIIGGFFSYIGSWRTVYIIYGVAQLILAIILFFRLDKQEKPDKSFKAIVVYKEVFSNREFIKAASLILLMGLGVFGSVPYAAEFVQSSVGCNVLVAGAALSCFGIGTIFGAKKVIAYKERLGPKFLILAGCLGCLGFAVFALVKVLVFYFISMFIIGIAFISLQSTLITYAQETNTKRRGTVMSSSSLFMFTGGAIGTVFYGKVINMLNIGNVYLTAAVSILAVGIIGSFIIDIKKL